VLQHPVLVVQGCGFRMQLTCVTASTCTCTTVGCNLDDVSRRAGPCGYISNLPTVSPTTISFFCVTVPRTDSVWLKASQHIGNTSSPSENSLILLNFFISKMHKVLSRENAATTPATFVRDARSGSGTQHVTHAGGDRVDTFTVAICLQGNQMSRNDGAKKCHGQGRKPVRNHSDLVKSGFWADCAQEAHAHIDCILKKGKITCVFAQIVLFALCCIV